MVKSIKINVFFIFNYIFLKAIIFILWGGGKKVEMDKAAERDEIGKEKNMVVKIKESEKCKVRKMDTGKTVSKNLILLHGW